MKTLVMVVMFFFGMQCVCLAEIPVPDEQMFTSVSSQWGAQNIGTTLNIPVPTSLFPDWMLQDFASAPIGEVMEIDFKEGQILGYGGRWPGASESDYCTILAALKYFPGSPTMDLNFSDLAMFEAYGYSRGSHHYKVANNKPDRLNPKHFKSNGAYAISCTLNSLPLDQMTVGFLKKSIGPENIRVYYH